MQVNHRYPQRAAADRSVWRFRLAALSAHAQLLFGTRAERVANEVMAAPKQVDSDLAASLRSARYASSASSSAVTVTVATLAVVRDAIEQTRGERPRRIEVACAWAMLQGAVSCADEHVDSANVLAMVAAASTRLRLPVHVLATTQASAEELRAQTAPILAQLGLSSVAVSHVEALKARQAAYRHDIVFVSCRDLALDYLRDRLTIGTQHDHLHRAVARLAERSEDDAPVLLRGLGVGIAWPADSVLLDYAKAPAMITAEHHEGIHQSTLRVALTLANELQYGRHFDVTANAVVELAPAGIAWVRERASTLGGLWAAPARAQALIVQALGALHCYRKERDYQIANDRIIPVIGSALAAAQDRNTLALIEARENVPMTIAREPLARISPTRVYRRYMNLCGHIAGASDAAGELRDLFGLTCVRIGARRTNPVKVACFHDEAAKAKALGNIRSAHTIVACRTTDRAAAVGKALAAGSETFAPTLVSLDQLPQSFVNAPDARLVLYDIPAAYRMLSDLDRERSNGDQSRIELWVSGDDPLIDSQSGIWRLAFTLIGTLPIVGPRVSWVIIRHAQRATARAQAAQRKLMLASEVQLGQVLSFSGPPE